jgi:hypothetical protein
MEALPPALVPLAAWPQFVTWRLVPSARPGKMDKLPCDWRTGAVTSAHSPATWGTFDECRDAVRAGRGDGVGFVFTANDPFFFLDFDGALRPDGQWSQGAVNLAAMFPGAAVETSQSGRGFHIIAQGQAPEHTKGNVPFSADPADGSVALYTELRFVALTGLNVAGDASTNHTPTLQAIVPQMFPPKGAANNGPDDWTTEPVPEWDGPASDDDLIRRALNSGDRNAAAAFGGDAVTFRDLWEGNADALAKRWPGENGPYDASAADAALAAHLAFWTGKNCERMRDLMYRSGLVRDKWEARGDYYLPRTIQRACGVSADVAKGASAPLAEPVPAQTIEAAGMAPRDGSNGFMGVHDQLGFFLGCVYVRSDDKVYVPDGGLLNQSRFNAVYGGFAFVLDAEGQKTTTSAWEAFTQNRVYRAATCHALCFRPEQPSGALIHEEGQVLLNTYVPITTLRVQGDAGPFLGFLDKLLPDERDRLILLSYMAALVQNPGRKFQWWPALQGTKGNGKSLILRVLSHAVGHRYTHLANVAKMARGGANFNAWVQGNLFVGLEEVFVANRRDFLEEFKPYVTNDRLPYEKKGVDETTGDNRCNGLALTNHKDGLPVDDDERRYAIFFTAQQSANDLVRDGMDGRYFPDLYDWLQGQGVYEQYGPNYGYAVVNNYLREYVPAEQFNPAGLCMRAPETSSTAAALVASRGRAEQEIIEAVESGRPGFAGGWVSSKAVDELLERIRASVPRTKRREMMQRLGYDYHPHLHDGRVNNVVQPDNAKPRLFIRNGHIVGNLTDAASIAKRYQADQAPGGASDAEMAFGENNS